MRSAIVGAVIGVAITLALGVWGVWLEWRHRREDAARELAYRRDQYLVESSADLATRVWQAIRNAESLEARKTVPWGQIYEILLDLSVALQDQAPRYRLAGVEAASQEIFVQLNGYLSARAVAEGKANANRELYRLVLKSVSERSATHGTPASQVNSEARAETGFDDTDVKRALELFRQKTFEQVRDRVRRVLAAVSKYQPGQPFELEENREPYSDFDEAWAAVTKDTMKRNESQPAVE